jgi:hypothetical protein
VWPAPKNGKHYSNQEMVRHLSLPNMKGKGKKYWTAATEKGWCSKVYQFHMRQVKKFASNPELVAEEPGRPQKVPQPVMDRLVQTYLRENPGATVSHKQCEAMCVEYLKGRMDEEGIVGPDPTLCHNTVGTPVAQ